MSGKQRILISGAGIGGPALAYWLLRYGFEPTLIEHAPAFRAGGYMIDVWGTGYDLVERYGLLEATRAHAYAFDRLKFVNARGHAMSGFGSAVFQRALAGRFFSIPRGDLARTLHGTVARKVETLYGTSIKELREDTNGVNIVLTSGESRRFDLVIGADGLHSRVREMVFGTEARFEKYLGYCAASFIVQDYPRRDESTYVSFARAGRQISRYAMRDNRTAFLLVFAQDTKPALSAHDIVEQKVLLHAKFGNDSWEAPEILARLDLVEDLYFDAVSQIRMPNWSRGRVALLGDAAYCPSLLAGAGATFAMLGAYVLAGELRKSQGDHVRAFAAYEGHLHAFMLRQQDIAVGLAGSFTPKTSLGLLARDCVVNLMNIPLVGAMLASRVLGERFPLPDYR